MSALLKLLNDNARKSPDQIVTLLRPTTWIQGQDMTADIWHSWRERSISLALCFWQTSRNNWYLNGTHYRPSMWTVSEINQELPEHWFMPASEYQDGVFPRDNVARRSRR
jgi:hypothetical protein